MTDNAIVMSCDRDSAYRIELNDVEITSNHEMLHCDGGTIIYLVGKRDAEVKIYLANEHIVKLRDKLNGIIKWKKLEEKE